MVREAAKAYPFLSSQLDLQERLIEFLVAFEKSGSRRNEIAHGVAIQFDVGGGTTIVLLPAFYSTQKYDPKNVYRARYMYGASAISEYNTWFVELITIAEALLTELEAMPRLSVN